VKIALAFVAALALAPTAAHAECKCMAVAGDVAASFTANVAKADSLYARGDFSGALTIYAQAYASSKESVLLYAQGMCELQLGVADKAKGFFDAYLKAGGTLAYRDRVEADLKELGGGVAAGVGGAVGGTAAVATNLGHTGLGVGETAVGAGVGASGAVVGDVRANVDKPQEKIGHKAGIILGVIAIAAIATVGIHSIAAGVSDSVDIDPKFDLGLGAAGVAVGISAIYVAGLTATTGAVGGAAGGLHCQTLPKGTPIVAPMAMQGGGGLAAAMSF
jgi:hypothetical protein